MTKAYPNITPELLLFSLYINPRGDDILGFLALRYNIKDPLQLAAHALTNPPLIPSIMQPRFISHYTYYIRARPINPLTELHQTLTHLSARL